MLWLIIKLEVSVVKCTLFLLASNKRLTCSSSCWLFYPVPEGMYGHSHALSCDKQGLAWRSDLSRSCRFSGRVQGKANLGINRNSRTKVFILTWRPAKCPKLWIVYYGLWNWLLVSSSNAVDVLQSSAVQWDFGKSAINESNNFLFAADCSKELICKFVGNL